MRSSSVPQSATSNRTSSSHRSAVEPRPPPQFNRERAYMLSLAKDQRRRSLGAIDTATTPSPEQSSATNLPSRKKTLLHTVVSRLSGSRSRKCASSTRVRGASMSLSGDNCARSLYTDMLAHGSGSSSDAVSQQGRASYSPLKSHRWPWVYYSSCGETKRAAGAQPGVPWRPSLKQSMTMVGILFSGCLFLFVLLVLISLALPVDDCHNSALSFPATAQVDVAVTKMPARRHSSASVSLEWTRKLDRMLPHFVKRIALITRRGARHVIVDDSYNAAGRLRMWIPNAALSVSRTTLKVIVRVPLFVLRCVWASLRKLWRMCISCLRHHLSKGRQSHGLVAKDVPVSPEDDNSSNMAPISRSPVLTSCVTFLRSIVRTLWHVTQRSAKHLFHGRFYRNETASHPRNYSGSHGYTQSHQRLWSPVVARTRRVWGSVWRWHRRPLNPAANFSAVPSAVTPSIAGLLPVAGSATATERFSSSSPASLTPEMRRVSLVTYHARYFTGGLWPTLLTRLHDQVESIAMEEVRQALGQDDNREVHYFHLRVGSLVLTVYVKHQRELEIDAVSGELSEATLKRHTIDAAREVDSILSAWPFSKLFHLYDQYSPPSEAALRPLCPSSPDVDRMTDCSSWQDVAMQDREGTQLLMERIKLCDVALQSLNVQYAAKCGELTAAGALLRDANASFMLERQALLEAVESERTKCAQQLQEHNGNCTRRYEMLLQACRLDALQRESEASINADDFLQRSVNSQGLVSTQQHNIMSLQLALSLCQAGVHEGELQARVAELEEANNKIIACETLRSRMERHLEDVQSESQEAIKIVEGHMIEKQQELSQCRATFAKESELWASAEKEERHRAEARWNLTSALLASCQSGCAADKEHLSTALQMARDALAKVQETHRAGEEMLERCRTDHEMDKVAWAASVEELEDMKGELRVTTAKLTQCRGGCSTAISTLTHTMEEHEDAAKEVYTAACKVQVAACRDEVSQVMRDCESNTTARVQKAIQEHSDTLTALAWMQLGEVRQACEHEIQTKLDAAREEWSARLDADRAQLTDVYDHQLRMQITALSKEHTIAEQTAQRHYREKLMNAVEAEREGQRALCQQRISERVRLMEEKWANERRDFTGSLRAVEGSCMRGLPRPDATLSAAANAQIISLKRHAQTFRETLGQACKAAVAALRHANTGSLPVDARNSSNLFAPSGVVHLVEHHLESAMTLLEWMGDSLNDTSLEDHCDALGSAWMIKTPSCTDNRSMGGCESPVTPFYLRGRFLPQDSFSVFSALALVTSLLTGWSYALRQRRAARDAQNRFTELHESFQLLLAEKAARTRDLQHVKEGKHQTWDDGPTVSSQTILQDALRVYATGLERCTELYSDVMTAWHFTISSLLTGYMTSSSEKMLSEVVRATLHSLASTHGLASLCDTNITYTPLNTILYTDLHNRLLDEAGFGESNHPLSGSSGGGCEVYTETMHSVVRQLLSIHYQTLESYYVDLLEAIMNRELMGDHLLSLEVFSREQCFTVQEQGEALKELREVLVQQADETVKSQELQREESAELVQRLKGELGNARREAASLAQQLQRQREDTEQANHTADLQTEVIAALNDKLKQLSQSTNTSAGGDTRASALPSPSFPSESDEEDDKGQNALIEELRARLLKENQEKHALKTELGLLQHYLETLHPSEAPSSTIISPTAGSLFCSRISPSPDVENISSRTEQDRRDRSDGNHILPPLHSTATLNLFRRTTGGRKLWMERMFNR